MRIIQKVSCALLLATPAIALGADSVQITAGRWQEELSFTSVSMNDQEVPKEKLDAQKATTFACISPAQAREPSLYFLDQQPGHNCAAPTGSVAGGRIAMASTCQMHDEKAGTDLPVAVTMEGTYGPQTYAVNAVADVRTNERHLVMHMVVKGRFAGACKGDEE